MRYINLEGKSIEPVEWIWKVIYRPTAEAMKIATEKSQARTKELMLEFNQRLGEMEARKADPKDIYTLREEYDIMIAQGVPPVREELVQYAKDGKYHYFAEIEQSRVEHFIMQKFSDPKQSFTMVIEPGMVIFHRYLKTHPYYLPADKEVRTFYFGWEKKIFGRKHKVCNHILPDGRIVQSIENNLDLVNTFNIGR